MAKSLNVPNTYRASVLCPLAIPTKCLFFISCNRWNRYFSQIVFSLPTLVWIEINFGKSPSAYYYGAPISSWSQNISKENRILPWCLSSERMELTTDSISGQLVHLAPALVNRYLNYPFCKWSRGPGDPNVLLERSRWLHRGRVGAGPSQ